MTHDAVNHPQHYRANKSGIETIEITEKMDFCVGNAVKYISRAGHKGDMKEDLQKAVWYLDRVLGSWRNKLDTFRTHLSKQEECFIDGAEIPVGCKMALGFIFEGYDKGLIHDESIAMAKNLIRMEINKLD